MTTIHEYTLVMILTCTMFQLLHSMRVTLVQEDGYVRGDPLGGLISLITLILTITALLT